MRNGEERVFFPGRLFYGIFYTRNKPLLRCGNKLKMMIKGESDVSKIYSVPGLFGGEDFYDENGKQVGYSVPGIFGGRDFYDADGQSAGYTVDGLISGEDFYGPDGSPQGYSVPGIIAGSDYYDQSGKPAGYSVPGIVGGENFYLNNDPFDSDDGARPDDFSWDE